MSKASLFLADIYTTIDEKVSIRKLESWGFVLKADPWYKKSKVFAVNQVILKVYQQDLNSKISYWSEIHLSWVGSVGSNPAE